MKLQLRLALGLSLCLSIVMIIICIVKMAGIRSPTNTMDLTWGVFWQFMEACIAVIMVSSTAFRSLFVAHGSGANSPPYKPSLPKRLLTLGNVVGKKRAGESDCKETKRLPEIPHATLTGMRTLIRGGPADGSVVRGEQSGNTDDQSISVKHEMWQKSENVSFTSLPPIVPPDLIWQLIWSAGLTPHPNTLGAWVCLRLSFLLMSSPRLQYVVGLRMIYASDIARCGGDRRLIDRGRMRISRRRESIYWRECGHAKISQHFDICLGTD